MNHTDKNADGGSANNAAPLVCSYYPMPAPEDIRAFRASLGLTQAEFARQYGVNISTVQRWEKPTGKALPTSKVAKLIDDIGQWVEKRWTDLRRSPMTSGRS